MTDTQDWLAQVQADSLSRLEAVSRMQRELDGLVGEAASPDGFLRVRVNPAGALVALHIDDRAGEALGGERVAAAILDLARKATERAAAEMHRIVGELVPSDDLDALLAGSVPPSARAGVDAELEMRRREGF
jgi:DNA-binding protein YbaB